MAPPNVPRATYRLQFQKGFGFDDARRIVPYVTVGTKVGRAERIGLIRLGSRVDVYLPQGIAPAVSVGDKTVAGVTGLDHG